MSVYRKKPVEIEAVIWFGSNYDEMDQFVLTGDLGTNDDRLLIHTLEGTMTASPGDYIIRGVKGEYYPCKPDIFSQTYEEVSA